MVRCIKCGGENPEDANFCKKCGSRLDTNGKHEPYKRTKDECFGLPHGSSIGAILLGIIIILWGISQIFDIEVEWWPFIIVIFGVLVITGAIYGLTRRGIH